MTFRQNICFHLQRYKILFIRKSFFHFFTTKKNGIKSGQLGLQCPVPGTASAAPLILHSPFGKGLAETKILDYRLTKIIFCLSRI